VSEHGRWSLDLPAARPRQVLVMKWSAIGDIALSSVVMEDIHRALPNTALDLDVLPRYGHLFEHDPRFRRLLGVDVRRPGLGGVADWIGRVGRARYDALVDLQSTDRSRLVVAALTLMGRAPPVRVGNHRHWPYTVAPPAPPREVHALDHLRASLNAAGIATSASHPVLYPGPANRERARALLARHRLGEGDYGLLMPGCSAAARLKRWGWRRFSALALALAQRGVARMLVVGADDEREECDAIARACPGVVVNACGDTELLDIVELATAARFVVSNDTGTAHVAAVAGAPLVVVCGPTDPRRVRPAGDRVRTLQSELWCRSCYRKACAHHACMEVLSPAMVLDALAALGVLDGAAAAAGTVAGR
jgi:heptosyltransferase-2